MKCLKLDKDKYPFKVVSAINYGSDLTEYWWERIAFRPDETMKYYSNTDIVEELGWVYSYSGPGQFFTGTGLVIKRTKSLIIVERDMGYDI